MLQEIYTSFYRLIASNLAGLSGGAVVELGSGIGKIKDVIPQCILTDLFPNPWIERVESAYNLSFDTESISDLILFDVFHHLRYPGAAFQEFHRVLLPEGRLILFEPCISMLGRAVYGLFHDEPVAMRTPIEWTPPPGWLPSKNDYYAAQGNATRIFFHGQYDKNLNGWKFIKKMRLAALSYAASGGYSKSQWYPDAALPMMRCLDKMGNFFPALFATRLLVVLEKK